MHAKVKTDEQYIESILKKHNRRNKEAIFYAVLGVVFGVIGYFFYLYISEKLVDFASSISSSLLVEGLQITKEEIKLIDLSNKISWVKGVEIGVLLGSISIVSGSLFAYALHLVFGSRKERIIIELYRKTKI